MSILPIPSRLAAPLDRVLATAVNGLEVARYGGLRTDDESSPYEVVETRPIYCLRRYFADADAIGRPPVLLVPPLMMTAEVWDVAPQSSAVSILHREGLDPWVMDFGDPEREPGGARRNVTDHVLAVADAIDRVQDATGQDVHIGGYSQGGLFCYHAAAYRSCQGIASIFTLGTAVRAPVLVAEGLLPEGLIADITDVESKLLRRTGLPGWAVGRMFKMINPANAVRQDLTFLRALHDREALLPRERQRRFLAGEGWVGWPGPAIAELTELFKHQRYLRGGLVAGERASSLADLDCPVLLFIGDADGVGPAAEVRAIVQAAPATEVYECVLPVGHFGLPVGGQAAKRTWPGVAAWVRWRSGEGALPEAFDRVPVGSTSGERGVAAPASRAASVTYGVGLATGAALSTTEAVVRTGRQAVETTIDVCREAAAQLPRLVRLERMGPSTRISWASMLDDLARRRPDDVLFLFDDRAYTHAATATRIDNVVRGLISLGVRRGQHVGVLMATRPSFLVAVAALNRIGAVAVLLRPGAPIAREAALGRISCVVSDPERAESAVGLGLDVFVLGVGSSERELPAGALDMEQIDPDAVGLPSWYRANPGRARDLAFIMFTGSGEDLRADRITNGRWAKSALAAALSAALTPSDTIYSVSPMHHACGLLLATAACAAGGCRLAMATRFDPATFWSEVRRYGVTVVPYTWTMLRELVDAEPHPHERHHPIRLFVGSGMPANLWRRVLERFSPAAVLELYASTRSGAIIGNVSGHKLGSVGRPLPGTPPVRVAAYDRATRRLRTGADGFAFECQAGETGMLLVDAGADADAAGDGSLRGVFRRDDAWIATGDLFRRDGDGDLWLVDAADAVIDTERGTVSPRAVEDALGALDAVEIAACYGVRRPTGGATLALAGVTLRPGRTLPARAVDDALAALDQDARPDVVHVLDAMPLTSWFRPALSELRAAGARPPGSRKAFTRDRRTGAFGVARRRDGVASVGG